MKKLFEGTLFVFFLGFLGAGCASQERSEFERALIGMEWVRQVSDFEIPPLPIPCNLVATVHLQQSKEPLPLGIESFRCDGRALELITKMDEGFRVTVLDALLLPKLQAGERYMIAGDCEMDGRTDTDFVAIVRFGKRERVDWKTGVRAAWLPNVAKRRFEPLSTRNIVCWKPTPP
jgi:hypothetical protein